VKTTAAADSAPAEHRPYVSTRLVGSQAEVAKVMDGLARVFGPGAIDPYGHSFPARRHGPDHVIVQMRVRPGRPAARRRFPRPRLRRRRPDVPAAMLPVSRQIKARPQGIETP